MNSHFCVRINSSDYRDGVFQKGHSTDHAIIQLIDQINNNFENTEFTIGVFIDLSKAFDTVDHRILLKKLIHYGVNGNNIRWFESYLTNRKQFLSLNNKNTNFANITYGVPQGSILGPLLFLIYVNDLCNASNILDPIILLLILIFSFFIEIFQHFF